MWGVDENHENFRQPNRCLLLQYNPFFLHAFGFGTLGLYWQMWKLPYFPPNETHLLWRINRKITLLLNSGIRELFNSGASLSLAASYEAEKRY